MPVLDLKNANNLYKGNNKVLKLYRGNNLLYEKVEETNEFIILYGVYGTGVRFLNPKTLDEVYYMDTGFPVFSIAYIGNDVFAVSSRNTGDVSVYIYKLNRDNNNFVLKNKITNFMIGMGIEDIYSFSNDSIKQTVFYYNSILYFFNGAGKGNDYFEIIGVRYDTSNFNQGRAERFYSSSNKKFSQNYYLVDKEGCFQIIDNYFLTSSTNGSDISVYEILSDGKINQIGNYTRGDCYIGYPLKDGKYLLPSSYSSSSSENSALDLYKGETKIKTIDENISYFNSYYSKFSYFNNKYYILGGENTKPFLGYNLKGIIEYDNETQTARSLSFKMNMGQNTNLESIIVSSKGNFYLKNYNIIKSYDSNYNLLLTKENSLFKDYKVIETVSL